MFVGRTLIPAPHGQLEAIYRPASERAERVALVLHPHPLYGGTMHNKVVAHTARALEAAGFVTLRFNFRGVGASSGTHDRVRGGVEDAGLALDYLLAHQPVAREVLVAGFSFGASVGLRFGCGERRVHRLLAIGTPASWLEPAFLAACAKPIAFIHGERDHLAPLAALEALVGRERVHVIPGADHFFEAHLDELRAAIEEAAAPPLTPGPAAAPGCAAPSDRPVPPSARSAASRR
jgi:alpha/beta superfamily hydrolase